MNLDAMQAAQVERTARGEVDQQADSFLGKCMRRRDKADQNIQAMIDEIEQLEAEI
jgi:hypothetical protein